MDMTVTTSSKGTNVIDWNDEYDSKPSPGEDRLTSAGKKDWASHMPDESDDRVTRTNHNLSKDFTPTSDAAKALDEGGYVWEATHSFNDENGISRG